MITAIILGLAFYTAFKSYGQMSLGQYPKSIWFMQMAIFLSIIALISYLDDLYGLISKAV